MDKIPSHDFRALYDLVQVYEKETGGTDPISQVRKILAELMKNSYNEGYKDGFTDCKNKTDHFKQEVLAIREKVYTMEQESYQRGYNDAMKKIAAESTLKPTAKPFTPKPKT